MANSLSPLFAILSLYKRLKSRGYVKEDGLSGTAFELYVYGTVRRYPAIDGWEIDEQCPLPDGLRVDFYVVRRFGGRVTQAVVVEAKDKEELELDDVAQAIHYKELTRAEEAIIYIANDCHVAPSVQAYAMQACVTISRTQWRR